MPRRCGWRIAPAHTVLRFTTGNCSSSRSRKLFVADIQSDGSESPSRVVDRRSSRRRSTSEPDHRLRARTTCCGSAWARPAMPATRPTRKTRRCCVPAGRQFPRDLGARVANTIGFDWHPVTGELWGLDHGIDFLGDDHPARGAQPHRPRAALRLATCVGARAASRRGARLRRHHQGTVARHQHAHGDRLHRTFRAHAVRVLPGGSFPAGVRRRRLRDDAWFVESRARVGL